MHSGVDEAETPREDPRSGSKWRRGEPGVRLSEGGDVVKLFFTDSLPGNKASFPSAQRSSAALLPPPSPPEEKEEKEVEEEENRRIF